MFARTVFINVKPGTIVGILLVLWLLGFSMHVGGDLIHALLVIAAVVFLFNLLRGRRSVV
jgi:uncharacterized protein DUF5670